MGYHPSKHLEAGHYRPTSETPFEWRFAGGPMVTPPYMLAGMLAWLTSGTICLTIGMSIHLYNNLSMRAAKAELRYGCVYKFADRMTKDLILRLGFTCVPSILNFDQPLADR